MKKKHFSLFLSISFSISLSLSSPSLTTYSLRNSITLQKIVNGWITGTYSAVANIWYIFFCFDNQSTFSSCQWAENLKAFCLGIQKQTLKISEDSNNSKSCFWCSLLSKSNFLTTGNSETISTENSRARKLKFSEFVFQVSIQKSWKFQLYRSKFYYTFDTIFLRYRLFVNMKLSKKCIIVSQNHPKIKYLNLKHLSKFQIFHELTHISN